MKPALHLVIAVSGLGLLCSSHLRADEERSRSTPAIPAALRPNTPDVPPDRNGLTRYLAECTPLSRAQTALYRESLNALRDGKPLAQPELLESLARAHQQAKKSLVPPLAFTGNEEPGEVTIKLYRLFQGAEILARQALADGNRPKADAYLADLQRWSLLLRNAQPDLTQWVVSHSGWRTSFNWLLEDWQNHPDQGRRLDELAALVQQHRTTREELSEAAKGDGRWYILQGGIKGILSELPPSTRMPPFLKEPFAQLTAAEVLELPYDTDAETKRIVQDTLELLQCLEQSTLLLKWPVFRENPNGHQLDHYRTIPNGLGDLFAEQAVRSSSTMQFWAAALGRDPLAGAALAWLKHERDGTEITPDLFRDFRDPVDGKPLLIDREARLIRCRGPNLKVDPPDETSTPLPKAGFHFVGDDQQLVVPRWRPAK